MRSNQYVRPAIITTILILTLPLFYTPLASAQGLDWRQASSRGFGNTDNWWVGSLVTFGDYLYAGTWNPLGAEIWRSSDGKDWSQVVVGGLGNAHNRGVACSAIFGGALYVGLYNTGTGAEVWRSSDGLDWMPAQAGGFGDKTNGAILSMVVFDGALYVGTWGFSNGGQVWRTADGVEWIEVSASGFGDPHNEEIRALVGFDGALYAGTYNQATGAQVWRTEDGNDWTQIVADGFGNSNNLEISSMIVYREALYAAVHNEVDEDELWRTHYGFNWTRVDGWPKASALTCMAVHEGTLFAASLDEAGAQLLSSRDGTNWVTSSDPGFGTAENKGVLSIASFDKDLYVATSNPTKGAGIYRTTGFGTSLVITAENTTVCAGETQSYDITFQNSGQRPLTRVVITDGLPALATFVPEGSSPGATLDTSTGLVSWEVGTLLPGEEITLHIEVRTTASVTSAAIMTNQARAEAQEIASRQVSLDTTLTRCAGSANTSRQNPVPTETSESVAAATGGQTIELDRPSPEIISTSDHRPSLSTHTQGQALRLPIILKPFAPD